MSKRASWWQFEREVSEKNVFSWSDGDLDGIFGENVKNWYNGLSGPDKVETNPAKSLDMNASLPQPKKAVIAAVTKK